MCKSTVADFSLGDTQTLTCVKKSNTGARWGQPGLQSQQNTLSTTCLLRCVFLIPNPHAPSRLSAFIRSLLAQIMQTAFPPRSNFVSSVCLSFGPNTGDTVCCHFCFFCFFHHRRTQQILKWDDKIFYFLCITWLNNLWMSWESESCPFNGHLDFCYRQTF